MQVTVISLPLEVIPPPGNMFILLGARTALLSLSLCGAIVCV